MRRALRTSAFPVIAGIAVLSSAWIYRPALDREPVTISGTVIDLACYFAKGDVGPKHLQCAEMCAKAGVPFGILTSDQKLYIPAKHGESSNTALMAFLEQPVTVTGTVYPAAGANTIEIGTITKKG